MKKLLFAFFTTAMLSLTFSSCGKYEDGPKLSLASKKSRLSGEWKLEKALHNEIDITSFLAPTYGTMKIEKDGKYTMTHSGLADTGTWKLGEDKDDITFTDDGPGAVPATYRILRLKSKELWWKQTQANGDVDEFHFKQ
jgi:Lipocalin-like domain